MHSPLTRTIRLLLAASLCGIASFWPVSADAAPGGVTMVEGSASDAKTWRFDPADIAVKVGTTVTWKNNTSQNHSVASDSGAFDSGDVQPKKSWKHRFDAPGDYTYACTPHPWMTGIVRVTP